MSVANTDSIVSSAILFPVCTHHIYCFSFKGTHSRQFLKLSFTCAPISFLLFSTRSRLKHQSHGFRRIQNRSRLNSRDLLHALFHVLHMLNPAPSGYSLLISTQIGSNQASFLTQHSRLSVWIETITSVFYMCRL